MSATTTVGLQQTTNNQQPAATTTAAAPAATVAQRILRPANYPQQVINSFLTTREIIHIQQTRHRNKPPVEPFSDGDTDEDVNPYHLDTDSEDETEDFDAQPLNTIISAGTPKELSNKHSTLADTSDNILAILATPTNQIGEALN